jgi:hypothetical protein
MRLLCLALCLVATLQFVANAQIRTDNNNLYQAIVQEASQVISTDVSKFQSFDSADQAQYILRPLFIKNHIVVDVTVIFRTNQDTNSFVGFFPYSNCNQHEYLVQEIQIHTPKAKISRVPNTLYWEIHHEPQSLIRLQYFVIQDSITLDNQSLTQSFPAILGRNYFFLENASLLALPTEWIANDNALHQPRRICIEWQADTTWEYTNSFGMNTAKQHLTVSAKDFMRSITVGGRNPDRCAISSWEIANKQLLYVATTGDFGSRNRLFAEPLREIASNCIRFWCDTSAFSFVAVLASVMMPPEDEENGVIGFAVANGFVGFFSDKKKSLTYSCKYLLAHEMLHKWINGERFPTHDYSGFGYCASEGFTDYLTRYLMVKNNLISYEEYLRDLNNTLRVYHTSSYRNVVADSIKKYFHQNLSMQKTPYYRGELLAHIWANEIRKHTNGKHDFATALRDIMQQHSGITIIDQIFAKSLEPYIGRNVIDDILKYMKNGETIPIAPDMIPFARLIKAQSSTDIPQFELLPESK